MIKMMITMMIKMIIKIKMSMQKKSQTKSFKIIDGNQQHNQKLMKFLKSYHKNYCKDGLCWKNRVQVKNNFLI